MDGLALTLTFGGIAALGDVVGGALVVVKPQWDKRVLTAFIAFGGGFMLAAALLKMVPESLRHLPPTNTVLGVAPLAPALFLAGYLVVHFFEHILGEHFHRGGEPHHAGRAVHEAVSLSTLIGLVVHTFFDGVAIGSGFAFKPLLGLLIFCAVMLHKIPEGATVASVVLAAGSKRQTAMWAAGMLAVATVIGAAGVFTHPGVAHYALPLATGVTVHVAATDLIPEVNEVRGAKVPALVLAGALVFCLTDKLLDLIVQG